MIRFPKSKLARLGNLSAAEWRWLLAALVLLPMAGLSLRFSSYQRTRALLKRWVVSENQSRKSMVDGKSTTDPVALQVVRMVSVAAHHGPYRANCLRQALVAWALLQQHGFPTELKVGVKKDLEGFAAHAWVESNGRIILGGEDSVRLYYSLLSVKDKI